MVRYNVHRSATSGFTPSAANRVAQVRPARATSTPAWPPAPGSTRSPRRTPPATSAPRPRRRAPTATADTTPPTVSLTAPAAGATVVGTVHLTANAADNVAVAERAVQGRRRQRRRRGHERALRRDVGHADGDQHHPHDHRRRARRVGNQTTSASRTVTVNNPPVDTTGLVAAYGFEEGTGAAVNDASTANNDGSITGASWSPAGKFGNALSFDGVDDRVNVADANTLDLSERHDARGVGPPEPARRLADRDDEGGGRRPRLLDVLERVQRPAERPRHHGRRARHPRPGLAAGRHLVAPRGDVRRRRRCGSTSTARRCPATCGRGRGDSPPRARCGSAATRSGARYFKGLIDEVRVYRRALTRDRDPERQGRAGRAGLAARRRARGDGPVLRAGQRGRSCRSTSRRSTTARSPSGTASTPR